MNKSPKKQEKQQEGTKTVSIRMPRELHYKILRISQEERRTLSSQCVFFLHKVLTPSVEKSQD